MPSSTPSERLANILNTFKYSSTQEPTKPYDRFRAKLPTGLPTNFTPLNPVAFLLKAAQTFPDKVALTHPAKDREWTYSEWADRISYFAHSLIDFGLKPGDRVAVLAPNVPMIADCIQAVPAARCIVNTINTRLTKSEVHYIVQHSGASLFFIDHEFKHLSEGLDVPTIVCSDTRDDSCEYEKFINHGKQISEKKGGWSAIELEANEDAGMALCYTSGTTGKPKGCLTTFRGSYLAAISNAFESGLTTDSKLLWLLPMFHCAGCFGWASTAVQATQVCLRSVDYTQVWNQFQQGVTHYCGAPTVHLGIINHPSARRLSVPVKSFVAGAAPTPALIKGLSALNIDIIAIYGLTESYGPFTRNYIQVAWKNLNQDDFYRKRAMQGKAFMNADEVLVVQEQQDGTEIEVPWDGETQGEICMRGNLVMKEYYKDPEATKKAFRNGYFHTGDVAVRMPTGEISIVDRSKDIIISGGENASSLKIESELSAHPDILEVAVVARKHEKFGERPIAYVVLHQNSRAKWNNKDKEFEQDLKKFARGKLAGFAIPEWVVLVTELPKTSTGKVQKNVLRQNNVFKN